MKVKVIKGFVYDRKKQKAGAIVEVKQYEADALIAAGRAEAVKEKPKAEKK